ncbi:MAG: monovalent cation/H+ antiporter complex subunit F, partial [Rickettsiales bacterium]
SERISRRAKWTAASQRWKGTIKMMFVAASGAVLVCMILALARAFMGPTLYDRVLAANAFGTKKVLMIALLGFLMGRPDFVDIALLYALINFIGTIAVLKFFRYGDLGQAGRERPAGEEPK